MTALLELYLQSDCSIRVFQSFNAGIGSSSISMLIKAIPAYFYARISLITISSLLHINFLLA